MSFVVCDECGTQNERPSSELADSGAGGAYLYCKGCANRIELSTATDRIQQPASVVASSEGSPDLLDELLSMPIVKAHPSHDTSEVPPHAPSASERDGVPPNVPATTIAIATAEASAAPAKPLSAELLPRAEPPKPPSTELLPSAEPPKPPSTELLPRSEPPKPLSTELLLPRVEPPKPPSTELLPRAPATSTVAPTIAPPIATSGASPAGSGEERAKPLTATAPVEVTRAIAATPPRASSPPRVGVPRPSEPPRKTASGAVPGSRPPLSRAGAASATPREAVVEEAPRSSSLQRPKPPSSRPPARAGATPISVTAPATARLPSGSELSRELSSAPPPSANVPADIETMPARRSPSVPSPPNTERAEGLALEPSANIAVSSPESPESLESLRTQTGALEGAAAPPPLQPLAERRISRPPPLPLIAQAAENVRATLPFGPSLPVREGVPPLVSEQPLEPAEREVERAATEALEPPPPPPPPVPIPAPRAQASELPVMPEQPARTEFSGPPPASAASAAFAVPAFSPAAQTSSDAPTTQSWPPSERSKSKVRRFAPLGAALLAVAAAFAGGIQVGRMNPKVRPRAPAAAAAAQVSPAPRKVVPEAVVPPPASTSVPASASAVSPSENAAPLATTRVAHEKPLPAFNPKVANAALAQVNSRARACKKPGGPSGTASAAVTFSPSGRVEEVVVSGARLAGTPVATCISAVLSTAKIRPFAGNSQTVKRIVKID